MVVAWELSVFYRAMSFVSAPFRFVSPPRAWSRLTHGSNRIRISNSSPRAWGPQRSLASPVHQERPRDHLPRLWRVLWCSQAAGRGGGEVDTAAFLVTSAAWKGIYSLAKKGRYEVSRHPNLIVMVYDDNQIINEALRNDISLPGDVELGDVKRDICFLLGRSIELFWKRFELSDVDVQLLTAKKMSFSFAMSEEHLREFYQANALRAD